MEEQFARLHQVNIKLKWNAQGKGLLLIGFLFL
jgi:hypothetical protein